MTSELLSLIGFAVAMYITPGPNNVMIAASAATHGIRATLPHMLGIAVGFAGMLVVVCGGLGSALLDLPWLLPALRWIGVSWLFVLAWKIATARPPDEGGRGPALGFFGAISFQWVNPKAWLIAVAAAGEYLSLQQSLIFQLACIFSVFLVVGVPCLSVWACFGSGARRVLRSPGRMRAFNMAMGTLLIASVLPVLFEDW